MLEKLRAKPDHIKKSISLVLTIVIFSIILFVWFSSWDARMRGDETREKTASPLSSFKMMLEGFVADVREGISSAPSYVENTPRVATSTTASTAPSPLFDISSVVIIDSTTSTTSSSTSAQ